MAENATELYSEMLAAVSSCCNPRLTTDSTSPTRHLTVEAEPCSTFELRSVLSNVPAGRSVDLRWATANVLHFFAAREDAAPLRRYCKHAYRFLDGDVWRGAYGACAVPQLRRCFELLLKHPYSRRAVVSFGELEALTVNLPRCMSFMQLLLGKGGLDLLVFQRSLSLAVMPYDTVLLTNILGASSCAVKEHTGALRWAVGNLHTNAYDASAAGSQAQVLLPPELLLDSGACWQALLEPRRLPEPFAGWLLSEKEVRT
jgi:hypothetical protein